MTLPSSDTPPKDTRDPPSPPAPQQQGGALKGDARKFADARAQHQGATPPAPPAPRPPEDPPADG